MISKKMQEAINKQINRELYSAYLYLSMAAWFEAENLSGMAKWMKAQYREETNHAMKFYAYIYDQLGSVKLLPIEQPQVEWKSPLDVFEEVCKHEKHVTDLINKLADLALAEKDKATFSMLKWFIDEQVEEEASADAVVQQLKMVGDNKVGIMMIDKELGARQ